MTASINRSTSPEFRSYQSNVNLLRQIAEITGGRVLDVRQPTTIDLFDRSGMPPSISHLPEMDLVAEQVYRTSGLGPSDVDAAILYDAFTPIVLWQLESFGFCPWGEAKDFVKDGNLELGGRLPTNTHGGQLSEAYIHGMNGVNEGVRLIRGTSCNQPAKADHVLVTGGVGVPTSGMILGRMD